MEQTDVMEQTQPVGRPVMPEPTWDPEKASKRKVRVLKVPYGQDPMTEKTVFEFGGFVYICYAVKTRGRYMIRCLGLADVERPREKEQTPFESGKLLDRAKKDIENEVFEKYKDDLALDDDGQAKVDKDIGEINQLEKELDNLDLAATKELSGDDMGDAIKEAIDDETVQQVIKEVTGDGGSRGPDETPNP